MLAPGPVRSFHQPDQENLCGFGIEGSIGRAQSVREHGRDSLFAVPGGERLQVFEHGVNGPPGCHGQERTAKRFFGELVPLPRCILVVAGE